MRWREGGRAGSSCSQVPAAVPGLDFPGCAGGEAGSAALTSGAAPGNVLHSSSWQRSGGFQQEGRNSRFQKKKGGERERENARRKRTLYNKSIVGEALLLKARLEIRTRCAAFESCTNVKRVY